MTTVGRANNVLTSLVEARAQRLDRADLRGDLSDRQRETYVIRTAELDVRIARLRAAMGELSVAAELALVLEELASTNRREAARSRFVKAQAALDTLLIG